MQYPAGELDGLNQGGTGTLELSGRKNQDDLRY